MRLRGAFRQFTAGGNQAERETQISRLETKSLDFVRSVWEAPALYNRLTRRRVRLFGRIWKWDLNASDETRRTFVPRYIRRHFSTVVPHTRRQRRHRARVLRIAGQKGIG